MLIADARSLRGGAAICGFGFAADLEVCRAGVLAGFSHATLWALCHKMVAGLVYAVVEHMLFTAMLLGRG